MRFIATVLLGTGHCILRAGDPTEHSSGLCMDEKKSEQQDKHIAKGNARAWRVSGGPSSIGVDQLV